MSSPSSASSSPAGGLTDLEQILATLSPHLDDDGDETYIFHTDPNAKYGDHADLSPVASIQEREGLTLVVPLSAVTRQKLADEKSGSIDLENAPKMKRITLGVHSSLEAVGLTAAVSKHLAEAQISANMIAGYHHDHVFVPAADADRAVRLLKELAAAAAAR